MIFDSQEQKEFFFKVLRSYVCPYGESLIINQKFAPAVQSGPVVDLGKQQEFLDSMQSKRPEPIPMDPSGNGAGEDLPEIKEGMSIADK